MLAKVTLAIFAASLLSAAGQEYSQRIWRMEDGLPHGRVQAISQTSDGYLWIGTSGGLVRFDGTRFVVFDRTNTPDLGDDSVLSLFAAKDGSLWIGTEGGGLVHYAAKKFTAYAAGQGLTNLFVRSIYQDRTGRLWIGTDRGFFLRKEARFVRLDGTPEIPYLSGGRVHEDRSGQIWIAGNGLYRVKDTHLILDHEKTGGRAIQEQPDGSHWFATSSGLYSLQGASLRQIHPQVSVPAILLKDSEGHTWIGAANGLFRTSATDNKALSRPELLPGNSVLALYRDREDNIWVGLPDGLVRLSRKLVSTISNDVPGADKTIFSIYKDPSDRMWIISADNQLYELKNHKLVSRPLPGLPAQARLRNLFQDRGGCLWVGTNQGLFRVKCGPVLSFSTANGLRHNGIRAFLQDRKGSIWVATGSGLARVDGDQLKVYYTDEGLAYGSVRSLLEDREGDLWIGTDGGLSRMRDGKFLEDARTKSLAGERIWALRQDAQGAIWIGTQGKGLFRLHPDRLASLGWESGLPKSVHQILEDRAGNIWMSGPAGVVSVKRQDLDEASSGVGRPLRVVSYGTAEGMKSVQMTGGVQPAGSVSVTGEVWFPSVNGAVGIPGGSLQSSRVPLALIEEVLVDGQPVEATNAIRIPAGASRLELQFTAPNLLSPERVSFQYKLEGFDRDWAYASSRRSASYTSLPPGDYKFRLIARHLALPEQPSEADVNLTWQPHFFQTSWFLCFCIALLIGSAWLGFRMYARQTRQRYALLLAERTRLAREMHDTVIQGCVGVSTLLEAASSFEESNPPMLLDFLNRARNQVRTTIEEAREAVWDLRHDRISGKLLDTLPLFAQQLSSEGGIPISVELIGEPIPLSEEADRNLLAATREAVRNAVAHGKPKHVRVVVGYSPDRIRIEVLDDGIGFESASQNVAAGHYGLLGMRERVERLGGSLRLQSHQSEGTQVIVELPLAGIRA